VLGRERAATLLAQVARARLLMLQRAAPELSR